MKPIYVFSSVLAALIIAASFPTRSLAQEPPAEAEKPKENAAAPAPAKPAQDQPKEAEAKADEKKKADDVAPAPLQAQPSGSAASAPQAAPVDTTLPPFAVDPSKMGRSDDKAPPLRPTQQDRVEARHLENERYLSALKRLDDSFNYPKIRQEARLVAGIGPVIESKVFSNAPAHGSPKIIPSVGGGAILEGKIENLEIHQYGPDLPAWDNSDKLSLSIGTAGKSVIGSVSYDAQFPCRLDSKVCVESIAQASVNRAGTSFPLTFAGAKFRLAQSKDGKNKFTLSLMPAPFGFHTNLNEDAHGMGGYESGVQVLGHFDFSKSVSLDFSTLIAALYGHGRDAQFKTVTQTADTKVQKQIVDELTQKGAGHLIDLVVDLIYKIPKDKLPEFLRGIPFEVDVRGSMQDSAIKVVDNAATGPALRNLGTVDASGMFIVRGTVLSKTQK